MEDNKKILNKYPKLIEFLKGIGTIFLYYILADLGSLLFSPFLQSSHKLMISLAMLGTYFVILLGLCFIYRKRLLNDFKNFKKENIYIAFKNWLCGLLIMMISNIIISFIIRGIATNESANRDLLKVLPLTSSIIMIFIAPLLEEITFRAAFKKAFDKWYLYCLVTGSFFGFAHIIASFTTGFNPLELLYIIPYGAMGFFFAKAFYDTDNIYTSFLAHCFHNFIQILLLSLF